MPVSFSRDHALIAGLILHRYHSASAPAERFINTVIRRLRSIAGFISYGGSMMTLRRNGAASGFDAEIITFDARTIAFECYIAAARRQSATEMPALSMRSIDDEWTANHRSTQRR